MNKAWMKVMIAVVLEVVWVIGLAHSDNFWTWTGTIIAIITSNYLMIMAGQVLPAGTVYAVFVGLGTVGTVISEIVFFGEPFKWEKTAFIFLLLIGVVGLKVVTDDKQSEGAKA